MNKRLLWITDADKTGYAAASQQLLHTMDFAALGVDLYVFGINTSDCNLEVLQEKYPNAVKHYVTTYPKEIASSMSEFSKLPKETMDFLMGYLLGFHDIKEVVNDSDPHLIIFINDNYPIELLHKKIVDKCPTWDGLFVPYMPIDCQSFPKSFFKCFANSPIITMTKYGASELQKEGSVHSVHVLPHVLNGASFSKLDATTLDRVKYLGPLHDKNFIVFNGNANQYRKRLDLTIVAFAKWLKKTGIEDAGLLLKCKSQPSINDGGFNIPQVVSNLSEQLDIDLGKHIYLIDGSVSEEDLNVLYNLADVTLSTTSGEGFGLMPLEAVLAGAPCIVPNGTSYIELLRDVCPMMDVDIVAHAMGRGGAMGKVITPDTVACVLKASYSWRDDLQCMPVMECIGERDSHIQTILCGQSDAIQRPQNTPAMMGNVNVHHYCETKDDLIEALQNTTHSRFQILIIHGEDGAFMRTYASWGVDEAFIKAHINAECMHHTVKYVEPSALETAVEGFCVKVPLPRVESAIELLEFYYNSTEMREMYASRTRDKLQALESSVVQRTFESILSRLILTDAA